MILSDKHIRNLCQPPGKRTHNIHRRSRHVGDIDLVCRACGLWFCSKENDVLATTICQARKNEQVMIEPFSEGVQGGGVISYGLSHAGYDLRLGQELYVFKNTHNEIIDPKRFRDEDYRKRVFDVVKPTSYSINEERGAAYIIPPHSYALGASLEYLRIPRHIKGRCVGKSTLARCGILINTTPLEPGWHGHLTIEISNITPCPALVYAGEGIAQLEFEQLSSKPESDYESKGGKYQGQGTEPVPARVL